MPVNLDTKHELPANARAIPIPGSKGYVRIIVTNRPAWMKPMSEDELIMIAQDDEIQRLNAELDDLKPKKQDPAEGFREEDCWGL